MIASIRKPLFLLIIFLISVCNDASSNYKPIAFGININPDKSAYEKIFEQYIKASVFNIVICPLPDNPQIANILKNGFVANYKKAEIGEAKAQYNIGIA